MLKNLIFSISLSLASVVGFSSTSEFTDIEEKVNFIHSVSHLNTLIKIAGTQVETAFWQGPRMDVQRSAGMHNTINFLTYHVPNILGDGNETIKDMFESEGFRAINSISNARWNEYIEVGKRYLRKHTDKADNNQWIIFNGRRWKAGSEEFDQMNRGALNQVLAKVLEDRDDFWMPENLKDLCTHAPVNTLELAKGKAIQAMRSVLEVPDNKYPILSIEISSSLVEARAFFSAAVDAIEDGTYKRIMKEGDGSSNLELAMMELLR